MPAEIDIMVRHDGSITLLQPVSEIGKNWIEQNVESEEWQWLGRFLGIDSHEATVIIEAAGLDGLIVWGDNND